MPVQEDQPAKVSYFFGKGYTDLFNTIKGAWSRNVVSAKDQWELARDVVSTLVLCRQKCRLFYFREGGVMQFPCRIV